MIWIIGGTIDSRILIQKMEEIGLKNYIVTVTTEEGFNQIIEYKSNVIIRTMKSEDMKKFIIDRKIDKIIDASHPFAKEVSKNARKVAKEINIKYIRYLRDEIDLSNTVSFESKHQLKKYLKNIKGNIFFTTGSKDIQEYERVKGNNRYIYRILPAQFSLDICKKNNIELKNIVALLGPFTKEFNKAFFENYRTDYVVMKDSGNTGGTKEKIDACLELGIIPLVIKRDIEEGISDLDKIMEMIL